MSTTYNARVRHKKDTHENWTANNPVLLEGELIIVVIDGATQFKVGDGSSPYTNLDFVTSWVTTEDVDAMFAGTYATS